MCSAAGCSIKNASAIRIQCCMFAMLLGAVHGDSVARTSLLYVGEPRGHDSPHAVTPPEDILTRTDSMTASLPYLEIHGGGRGE